MREAEEIVPLLEKLVVVGLFLGLLYGIFRVLEPFGVAILFGTILAVAVWPLRAKLTARGLSPAMASLVLLVSLLVLVLVPILLVAPTLATETRDVFFTVHDHIEKGLPPPAWLASIPVVGPSLVASWENVLGTGHSLGEVIAPYSEWLRSMFTELAKSLADSALQLILALLVCVMMLVHGPEMVTTLDDILARLGGKRVVSVASVAENAIRGSVYGIAGTAAIQAGMMWAGLVAARVPGALPLAFITLILAISQIGSILIHLVWIGAAWWLYQQGDTGFAFWFIIVWGIIVAHVDGFLKPWLIGTRIRMPIAMIMLGVFGGFVAFGFLGLFIGPTILAIGYALLTEWRKPERMEAMMASGEFETPPAP
ncbi:MAG: AI-2E family transporter [Hyphomicrobiales bacterium]